ncbi:hypothetical protein A11M_0113270 [Xanthomonas vasicola pv. vasculorum NCPPB 895]|nr:hypothetical protein A11M_0113270 [Xanthomonas vasicola pv. vasculorum NCPPB 895]
MRNVPDRSGNAQSARALRRHVTPHEALIQQFRIDVGHDRAGADRLAVRGNDTGRPPLHTPHP